MSTEPTPPVSPTNPERVSVKEKIGYALGDTASNLFWMTFVFYGTYFYTDVFGISAALVGTLFGITRLWDAVNDPMMGIISDKTETRWGKFRPYFIWMVVPFAVLGVATFTTPDWAQDTKVIYAFVTYTLFGMVYTAINLPYSSLMGVMSADPNERTSISTYRFVGAYSGGLIVSMTLLPLVAFFGGEVDPETKTRLAAETTTRLKTEALETGAPLDPTTLQATIDGAIKQVTERQGFAMTMMVFGVIAIAFWIITFLSTKERVRPPEGQKSDVLADAKGLLTNVPWLILFALGIFTLAQISIRNAAAAYYFKYYVGDQSFLGGTWSAGELTSFYFTASSLAAILGTPLGAPLARKLGNRGTYLALMGAATLFTVAFYFIPPSAIWSIMSVNFFINFMMGPTAALVFAMYTDAADFSEWKTGRRATGMIMSASSLAQKLGWTVGGMLGGFLLAAIGYEPNKPQSEDTIQGLRYMISFLPAVGALGACAALSIYPLNATKMSIIQKELSERRRASSL